MNEIHAQFETGRAIRKIAKDFGISEYKAFKMHDEWLEARKANQQDYAKTVLRLSKEKREAIYSMFKAGMLSTHQIGILNGLKKGPVQKMYDHWLSNQKQEYRKNRELFTPMPVKVSTPVVFGQYDYESLSQSEKLIYHGK